MQPDFARLREIAEEAQQLEQTDGSLKRADFDRLFAAAQKASGGDDELCEFIANREPLS
jgi:hypothetical protein